MEQKTQLFVALVTAPAGEGTAALARTLVERKLAACVNIIPRVRSIYRWEGRLCDDAEDLLVIKTTEERLPELQKAVLELHSYTTPEFVAFRAETVSEAYLQWVLNETRVS